MNKKVREVLRTVFYPLVLIRRAYIRKRNAKWAEENPKALANYFYKSMSGRDINWEHPLDLSEKINWMKFHSDTTLWTKYADKYLVREYVEKQGLSDILVKLYGVWEHAEDIDFDTLPNKFVLKSNHACGTVMIVKDKSKLDINKTREILNNWLTMKIGKDTAEPHYLSIKPLLMAEEYLESEDVNGLIDYKLFTVHGNTELVMVCSERVIGTSAQISLYDTDWNFSLQKLDVTYQKKAPTKIPKPTRFEEMKKYAAILAKDFPFVRMDFYEVNGKVYFGEMTFTPKGGYCSTLSSEEQLRIGKLITLPQPIK